MTEDVSPSDASGRSPVYVGRVNSAILRGEEDLSVWSDEELRRGQRKSSRGRWEGRPPAVVPKKLHDELVRRTMDAAHAELRDSLVDAVKLLRSVIRDPEAANSDKIKAASIVMDRLLPKQIAVEAKHTFAVRVEELEAAIGENEQLKRVKERLGPKVIEGEVAIPGQVERAEELPWQEAPVHPSPTPRQRDARYG